MLNVVLPSVVAFKVVRATLPLQYIIISRVLVILVRRKFIRKKTHSHRHFKLFSYAISIDYFLSFTIAITIKIDNMYNFIACVNTTLKRQF